MRTVIAIAAVGVALFMLLTASRPTAGAGDLITVSPHQHAY